MKNSKSFVRFPIYNYGCGQSNLQTNGTDCPFSYFVDQQRVDKVYSLCDSNQRWFEKQQARPKMTIISISYGGWTFKIKMWPFLKLVNFKLISTMNILCIFCEIAIRWMPQHLTDHKSTLVQVMAWCRQAPSHYLYQCWPRSLSPRNVTRPRWVKPALKLGHGWVKIFCKLSVGCYY